MSTCVCVCVCVACVSVYGTRLGRCILALGCVFILWRQSEPCGLWPGRADPDQMRVKARNQRLKGGEGGHLGSKRPL